MGPTPGSSTRCVGGAGSNRKEEEGAKNSTTWDSRAHVYLTRLAPFYQHFLSSIGQNIVNPEVGAGYNSVMV